MDLLSWTFYALPLFSTHNHCFSLNKVSSDIMNDKRKRYRVYWINMMAIWRNICQLEKWLNNLLYIASEKQTRHNNLWSKATTVQTFRGRVTFAIVLSLKHVFFRVFVYLWTSIKLHHIYFSFYILNDIEPVEMKTDDTFIVPMHNIFRWNFHILVACAPPKCSEFTYQIMLCDFSKSIFIMN